MKNHLAERLLSASWLGVLGYLLIPSTELQPTYWLSNIALLLSLTLFCFGFFFSYKSLLMHTDIEKIFIVRFVAATWLACIGFFMAFSAILKVGPVPSSDLEFVVIGCVELVFFLLGYFWGYQLLLLPRVRYTKSLPTYTERLTCSIWFGAAGYLVLAWWTEHLLDGPLIAFITLLTSYLGFYYGYRIILLPYSTQGAVKALMIGFIGSSYALIILYFLMLYFSAISSSYPVNHYRPHDILEGFTLPFIFFPFAAMITCIPSMILTILLYISRHL